MAKADFKIYLQTELLKRIKANPRYSLRAFAAQLDLDPSTLSKMLKGKRPMGQKMILQLSSKLSLTKDKVDTFLNIDDSDREKDSYTYKMLALDQFSIISDWYHFAILELMMVKGFKPDHAWIAKALGLKTIEVETAVERLIRAGLLEITKSGKWIDLSSGFTTNIGPSMTSSAHGNLQQQLLQKAIEAQKSVRLEKRDHTAMTMAIDSKRMEEAKLRIKKFRRSLTKFLTEGESKDAVFSLNIALFPLTKQTLKGENYEN